MADADESHNHRGAGSAPQSDSQPDAKATRPQQEPSLSQSPKQEDSEPDREPQPAQGGNEDGGGQINFDFTPRGPEYAASSVLGEDLGHSYQDEIWSPPADDDSSSSSATESEPAEETARHMDRGRRCERKLVEGLERIQLVRDSTIIDKATGLPTPVDARFPVASVDGDSIRAAVSDDFRTDWVLPPDASGTPRTTRAAPPWIPDPMDDSPDPVGSPGGRQARCTRRTKQRNKRKKSAAAARRKTPPQGRRRKQAGRPTVRPEQQPEPEPEPEGLFKISAELRLKIYRELLLADTPIIVHGGWRLVYRHPATRQQQQQGERARQHGLGLCIAILCAHPLFCTEGLTVLYGENTFLYRLRDPTPTIIDVSRLVYLDDDGDKSPGNGGDGAPSEQIDVVDYDSDESASDWEQERRAEQGDASRRRRSRRKRTKKARCDIYFEKYRHLFRSIIVEAEHNRFSSPTMRAMARAILAFGPGSKPAPNIRTLVVRVAPLRVDRGNGGPGLAGGDEEQQHFTFVDFFATGSPVLEAIQAVECRFLRVDLMTRYMDGPAERAGCSLTVDRRPEMVARRYFASLSADGQHDTWIRGPAARRERKRRARLVLRALQNLSSTVRDFCRSYVHRRVGGWNAFDDIDDGF